MNHLDAFEVARLAARVADEKMGEEIIVVDVRKESTLVDCFLLVTGLNHIHIGALEDSIRESLRVGGAKLVRTDGQRGHLWRALDYGNFIVHIMDKKTRDFYALEKLWERGKPLPWKMAAPKARPVKPKPKPSAVKQKQTSKTAKKKGSKPSKKSAAPSKKDGKKSTKRSAKKPAKKKGKR